MKNFTKKSLRTALLLGVFVFGLSSCKKTVDPPEIEDNEVITTVKLQLTNPNDSTDTNGKTAIWRKVSLADTSAPDTSQAFLILKPNTMYTGSITLLDETKNPVANVSEEILELANEHLFFYYPTSGLNLTVVRTDHDTNNPPLEIGLQTTFTTGNVSNGRINVILRHQPNVKDGTYTPGSTDVDVKFDVTIHN